MLPGSHKLGKIDIKDLVSLSKSERIEGAVPLICDRGDVVICNRQALHGSFPNSGFEPRLTVNFGFHKRSSVLGVKGGGIHADSQVFNDEIITRRSRVLGDAVAARKERFPKQTAYEYKPFTEQLLSFVWDDAAREDIHDYNRDDLSI